MVYDHGVINSVGFVHFQFIHRKVSYFCDGTDSEWAHALLSQIKLM